jgi:RNA polymerase sigma factor (sigma-70 family)
MILDSGDALSEVQLWQAFKRGDEQAFARLYEILIHDLLRYGYRIQADQQLVRDSIHDVFLHLWNHRENLADTTSVKFYLYRALRNRILRNQGSALSGLALPINLVELPTEELWIEQETNAIQIDKLRRLLEHLPKRQQEAIQLRYYHDFTPDDIAAIMDINVQSVRNLLHRAILYLRETFVAIWLLFTQLFSI